MRIVFIGSSHGLPEPNRRCSCILIEVGESRYFIDMGTQAIEDLATRGIAVESVKGIFVTHMHGDHTNGLLSFVSLCNWYYTKADPAIYLPGDLDKSVNAIKSWIEATGHKYRGFRFGHVDDGFTFEDENIRITAYRTKHIENSFSYLVECEGKRVYFSGDLKSPPVEDIPLDVVDKGLDLAVLELAHFRADEKYLPVFQGKTQVKRICINHYSDIRLASYFTLRDSLPEIPVCRAYDGLEIFV